MGISCHLDLAVFDCRDPTVCTARLPVFDRRDPAGALATFMLWHFQILLLRSLAEPSTGDWVPFFFAMRRALAHAILWPARASARPDLVSSMELEPGSE